MKTDGLAAGKGVLVADTLAEAEADVAAKFSGDAFGDAGRRVIVEEGLSGPECSLLVLCDGRRVVPLAPSQDFKRLSDGDTGPNTGGMGAYSPVPEVDDDLVHQLLFGAVEPLVAVLRSRGIDYRGVLYAGLMLTPEGPKVLEYNVRFGDPEAQAVLPRLTGDPVEASWPWPRDGSTTWPTGELGFADDASVCVVLPRPRGTRPTRAPGDPIAGLAERPAGRSGRGGDRPPRRDEEGRRRTSRSRPPAAGCSGSPPSAPTWARPAAAPTRRVLGRLGRRALPPGHRRAGGPGLERRFCRVRGSGR